MAMTLKLTGWSGGDLNLIDNTNYSLRRQPDGSGWQPAVSRRRRSQMAGVMYEPVMERIPLRVFGSTAAAALGALHDLTAALDQAERWRLNDRVDPVLIEYQPNGSTLSNSLQAVVFGALDSGQDIVGLSPRFHSDLRVYEIELELGFIRAGLWLTAEDNDTSSSVSNPGLMTATLGSSHDISSPVRLVVDGFNKTTLSGGINGYLAVANHAGKLTSFDEAEDYSVDSVPGSGTFNTSSDSAASGGSIRKLVPNSAGVYVLTRGLSVGYAANEPDEMTYALLMSVRNNSSTISYQVYGEWSHFGVDVQTKPIVIDTLSQNPQVVNLGTINLAYGKSGTSNLYFEPSGTGGSGDALDVDWVMWVRIDSHVNIISFADMASNLAVATDLIVDHRFLEKLSGAVYELPSGGDARHLAFGGSPAIHHLGNTVVARVLATTGTHWRAVSGTTTVLSLSIGAYRRKGYLVPQ